MVNYHIADEKRYLLLLLIIMISWGSYVLGEFIPLSEFESVLNSAALHMDMMDVDRAGVGSKSPPST